MSIHSESYLSPGLGTEKTKPPMDQVLSKPSPAKTPAQEVFEMIKSWDPESQKRFLDELHEAVTDLWDNRVREAEKNLEEKNHARGVFLGAIKNSDSANF